MPCCRGSRPNSDTASARSVPWRRRPRRRQAPLPASGCSSQVYGEWGTLTSGPSAHITVYPRFASSLQPTKFTYLANVCIPRCQPDSLRQAWLAKCRMPCTPCFSGTNDLTIPLLVCAAVGATSISNARHAATTPTVRKPARPRAARAPAQPRRTPSCRPRSSGRWRRA